MKMGFYIIYFIIIRAILDENSWSIVEWKISILLVKSHKLDP
jgi:hypothetical protein